MSAENQFMDVTNILNEKLHRFEILYEHAKDKNLKDVNDLSRIKDCFDNLIEMEEDRQTKGGGYKNLPTRLKNPDQLSYTNKQLYDTLCKYKDTKDHNDSLLRERMVSHVDEIKTLQGHIRRLEEERRVSARKQQELEEENASLIKQRQIALQQLVSEQVKSSVKGEEFVNIIMGYSMREKYYRSNCKKILPMLKVGMESTDPMLKKLCDTVNRILHVMEDDEYYPYYENEEMKKHDKKPKLPVKGKGGKGGKGGSRGGRNTITPTKKPSTTDNKKSGISVIKIIVLVVHVFT